MCFDKQGNSDCFNEFMLQIILDSVKKFKSDQKSDQKSSQKILDLIEENSTLTNIVS